jgi:alkane 1-monooxygenase
MPTGYPGMMLLSLVPPLWFAIMNRRIEKQFATVAA